MTTTDEAGGAISLDVDQGFATSDQAAWFFELFERLVGGVETIIVGKTRTVRLALITLLSGGHLLLEDVPGTGKTSLARAISQCVAGKVSRIQFTPDLLPGDITGVNIYSQRTGDFEFHAGPIFANVVLADEINRASPKTQAALLEVMEESRVTIDGVSREVPKPFMVIATQNPVEQAGTYRLPEAQLDRFFMRTSLGYPDHASLVRILEKPHGASHNSQVPEVATTELLDVLAALAANVYVDAAIIDYVVRLVEESRNAPQVLLGASVRAAQALVQAAKTMALSTSRNYVVPDDVKALAEPVLAHRIIVRPEAEFDGVSASSIVNQLLMTVAPPADGSSYEQP